MQLAPLPETHEPLVCVGTSVRKSLPVLKPYLDSLAYQEPIKRGKTHYVFVADFTKEQADAEQYLREWVKEREGEVLRGGPSNAGDFLDSNAPTHQWTPSATQRVGANKNKILQRAVQLKADAIWLADADLILDRTTLTSLWAVEKPIACAVYWTHWQKAGRETQQPHAAPQVWLRHPYILDGRGMEEWEFRAKLVNRELTRVWGQGACSLIRTPVVQAGISFDLIPEPQLQVGMMAFEDRHFCIRAERAHIDMWAEPWPDIFHIYHLPDDLQRVEQMVARLSAVHPARAGFGDAVSLRLDALEPFPQPNNQWYRPPGQFLRGRIGALPLLPELEEAVLDMDRGSERIVPVHVPLHYPLPYMRGKRRLIRVQLLDVKPYGFAPVVEQELIVGKSQRAVDSATLSSKQIEGMQELATAHA